MSTERWCRDHTVHPSPCYSAAFWLRWGHNSLWSHLSISFLCDWTLARSSIKQCRISMPLIATLSLPGLQTARSKDIADCDRLKVRCFFMCHRCRSSTYLLHGLSKFRSLELDLHKTVKSLMLLQVHPCHLSKCKWMQNTAEDLINMDPSSRIRDSYRGQWWINLFKQPQLAKLAKWIHPIYKLGHMIFRCMVKVTVTLCVVLQSESGVVIP